MKLSIVLLTLLTIGNIIRHSQYSNFYMDIVLVLLSILLIISYILRKTLNSDSVSNISKKLTDMINDIDLYESIDQDKKSFLKIKIKHVKDYFVKRCLIDITSFSSNIYNEKKDVATFKKIVDVTVDNYSREWLLNGYSSSFITKFNNIHNVNISSLLEDVINNIRDGELTPDQRIDSFTISLMRVMQFSIEDFIKVTNDLETLEDEEEKEMNNTSEKIENMVQNNNKIYTEISVMLDNKRLGIITDPIMSKYLTLLVWIENIDHKVMLVNDVMGIEHIDKEYIPVNNIEILKELPDNSAFIKYIETRNDITTEYIGIRQYIDSDNILKEPYYVYYCMPSK